MDDYIAKIKEPLTRQMYDEIMAGNYEVLNVPDSPLFMELYDQMRHNLLRPKVIVDYVREPYVCHNGNVRITFDKELRTVYILRIFSIRICIRFGRLMRTS